MTKTPLVSVMLTSYNQRNSLIRAIDSILNQTYKNIQIVITDDHSTLDDSKEVILTYKKKYGEQIKPIFQKKNVGIVRNKNTGFRACDGEYITYLDGDDFYYPKKIEQELTIFNNNKSVEIVYSNFAYTNISGQFISNWTPYNWSSMEGNIFKYTYSRMFPRRTLYRCELMKKKVLKTINYYDEELIAYEDWDSRIRMSKEFKVAYCNYIGSAYVNDPSGISKTEKKIKLLKEMYFVYEKNKPLLNDLSNIDKNFIITNLEHFLNKESLLVELNKKSIKSLISHLYKYPHDVFDYNLFINLFFSPKTIKYAKNILRR